MAYPTKITTCCYCGARAALVLKGSTRHELACGSCGAPLHELKMLPRDRSGDRELVAPSAIRNPKKKKKTYSYEKPRKKKKRKGWMREVFEEAIDLLEDVFD